MLVNSKGSMFVLEKKGKLEKSGKQQEKQLLSEKELLRKDMMIPLNSYE